MNFDFSTKELTLIKKARTDVVGALNAMRGIDLGQDGIVASIQAILLLKVIDDLLVTSAL